MVLVVATMNELAIQRQNGQMSELGHQQRLEVVEQVAELVHTRDREAGRQLPGRVERREDDEQHREQREHNGDPDDNQAQRQAHRALATGLHHPAFVVDVFGRLGGARHFHLPVPTSS
ncbi:MAG: hypothetical protein HND48_11915 [Chloroflexi bacterium]|nr:hypothetical protein [Chloroflexota bacterium]